METTILFKGSDYVGAYKDNEASDGKKWKMKLTPILQVKGLGLLILHLGRRIPQTLNPKP